MHRVLCHHCKRLPAAPKAYNRGLCHSCFKRKEVRNLYPPPPRPDRGVPRNASNAPSRIAEAEALLPEVGVGPVSAPACSPLRLAALINRVESGAPLWRKDDDLEGEG